MTLFKQRRAIVSGDDCVQQDEKEYFDRNGYEQVKQELEWAFMEVVQMIVNAKKQINIKLNGYPLVDFLQLVYTQYNGDKNQKGYKKFMRQVMAYAYTERYSRLYLVLQWVIVHGKMDSSLCEENLDFAASVLKYAGQYLQEQSQKIKYKPPVPIQYWSSRSKLFWNNAYTPLQSVYFGLEQFMGIVKKYGHETLGALVRYALQKTNVSAEHLTEEFASELETRAPHKEELGRTLFESLDEETQKKVGWQSRKGKAKIPYVSHVPELFKILEEKAGVAVNSVELDEPLIGAEVQHQDSFDGTEDEALTGVDESIGE